MLSADARRLVCWRLACSVAVLSALAAAGCGRLGYRETDGGSPEPDTAGPGDAWLAVDGMTSDATPPGDAGEPDATPPGDAATPGDSGGPDAGLAPCPFDPCSPGMICCGLGDPPVGSCLDPLRDRRSCGGCGIACADGQDCDLGTCVCASGRADCDLSVANGCEVTLATDTAHCGSCDVACAAGRLCASGACECLPGTADCDGMAATGCETVLATDPLHCGACGVACGPSATCAGGTCACIRGFADCTAASGCETNVTIDSLNCGDCGITCPLGTTCMSAVCSLPPIDLVVSALSASVSSAGVGTTVPVGWTVTNLGLAVTTVTSQLGFYLSADATITTSDRRLGSRSISGLGPGADASGTTSLYVPLDVVPGVYTLGAIADDQDQQPESNEANNARTGPTLTVVRDVDLVVSALSASVSSAGVGTTVPVDWTVTNLGTTVTTVTSQLGFYLSADATITTSDRRLGSRSISGLGPGADASGTTSLYLPLDVVPGVYYLGAIADDQDVQPESNEANNARTGPTLDVTL